MSAYNQLLNGTDYDALENDGISTIRPKSMLSTRMKMETPSELFVSLPAELTSASLKTVSLSQLKVE